LIRYAEATQQELIELLKKYPAATFFCEAKDGNFYVYSCGLREWMQNDWSNKLKVSIVELILEIEKNQSTEIGSNN
jgi:hypothetical protein